MKNPERIDRHRMALRTNRWDLVVCALPKNVLLLSGYWPVVGTGVAVAPSDGRIALLVPEDEEELAKAGSADEVHTFKPGSLDRLTTAAEAIKTLLHDLFKSFSGNKARVAFESSETSEPAPYAAMHLYGGQMESLLQETLPNAALDSADEVFATLRATKTDVGISRLRTAA